jgi:hypothetical protein
MTPFSPGIRFYTGKETCNSNNSFVYTIGHRLSSIHMRRVQGGVLRRAPAVRRPLMYRVVRQGQNCPRLPSLREPRAREARRGPQHKGKIHTYTRL